MSKKRGRTLASLLNSLPFLGAKNNPIKNPIITPKVKVLPLFLLISSSSFQI